MLGSDFKEESGVQGVKQGTRESHSQVALAEGQPCGRLGFDSVQDPLRSCSVLFQLVLSDPNGECYSLIPTEVRDAHGMGASSLPRPGLQPNASEGHRVAGKVLQVSSRRQQRNPEQEVRDLGCRSGGSVRFHLHSTGRDGRSWRTPV